MLSNGREGIVEVFDALHTAVSRLTELSFEMVTTPERLELLERLEQVTRRLPIPRHALINGVRREATAAEIGGKLPHVLADRLRITRAEAARRIDEAADLGQRSALTGQPLAPQLPATAAVQHDGKIGSVHVRVIRGFLRDLPCWVDADTRAHAEAQLADLATQYRPEQLGRLANKLADCLNPDGDFSDQDRVRRRGLTLGEQDRDGMPALRGWLTPTARAALEAVLVKLAARGMADPYAEEPVLNGTPSQDAIDLDTRSPAQHNHDGLHAALASGSLGQHNGLPASMTKATTPLPRGGRAAPRHCWSSRLL
jgi:uncharacterized protein DUF222